MNTKTIMATALAGACVVIGCVSIDTTRTQLSSSNPQEVQKAEQNIFVIATTGKDATGFVQFDVNQQIEYVNLASNNALLFKIIDSANESLNGSKVIVAAASKIDFSKPGVGKEILTRHKHMLDKVSSAERCVGRGDEGPRSKSSCVAASIFSDKVFASLNEEDLITTLSSDDIDYSHKKNIAMRLIVTTKDPQLLLSFYDGDRRRYIDDHERVSVVRKLAGMPDKLSDANMVLKVLNASENGWHPYIKDYDTRAKLLAKLPSDEAIEYALKSINKQDVDSWGHDDLYFIYDGVAVANSINSPGMVIEIVSAVLSKVEKIKQSCGTSMLVWDAKEENKATDIINRLPKLDDATIEQLICKDTESWRSFINAVSPKIAYNVLLSGKAKSSEIELAMIKKLPKEKVDAAIYAGARFAKARKAIYNSMSAEMKKSADVAREKAYKAIMEKAKAAEKETFALESFYLGMTFDDMLVAFDYHFPNIEVNEAFDGDKADADYVIYVEGQRSPFCYATRKDKKVYQFNFGKRLLKKWYQYDVQTPMEWAHAYEREMKIDMKFKLVEKDTTVYEMDMSRSYRVWFHQESYQYKHNSKEYRLTYFGEEKDFTFEGGIGGAIIKEQAAPRFRYVRGDPGSLRARIERD